MVFLHNIYKLVQSKLGMDYDKFGIIITIIIVGVLVVYALTQETGIVDIPPLFSSEVETTISSGNTFSESDSAYYEWCYKMGLEC